MTVLFFSALAASVAFPSPNNWTPANTQIAEMETSIRLEKLAEWKASGLPSLPEYERFYTGYKSKGDKVILGELVLATETGQHPGIHIVSSSDDFPSISGGGCGIINLVYSVSKNAVTSIRCNGPI